MAMSEPLPAAVLDSLGDDPALPLEDITIRVGGTSVVLTGTVPWRYQRDRIEYLVERVEGVRVVRNEIEVIPTADATLALADSIGAAARRAGDGEDGRNIRVEIDGEGTLTLLGDVRSDDSYRAALYAAWAVPGVQDVRERLTGSVSG